MLSRLCEFNYNKIYLTTRLHQSQSSWDPTMWPEPITVPGRPTTIFKWNSSPGNKLLQTSNLLITCIPASHDFMFDLYFHGNSHCTETALYQTRFQTNRTLDTRPVGPIHQAYRMCAGLQVWNPGLVFNTTSPKCQLLWIFTHLSRRSELGNWLSTVNARFVRGCHRRFWWQLFSCVVIAGSLPQRCRADAAPRTTFLWWLWGLEGRGNASVQPADANRMISASAVAFYLIISIPSTCFMWRNIKGTQIDIHQRNTIFNQQKFSVCKHKEHGEFLLCDLSCNQIFALKCEQKQDWVIKACSEQGGGAQLRLNLLVNLEVSKRTRFSFCIQKGLCCTRQCVTNNTTAKRTSSKYRCHDQEIFQGKQAVGVFGRWIPQEEHESWTSQRRSRNSSGIHLLSCVCHARGKMRSFNRKKFLCCTLPFVTFFRTLAHPSFFPWKGKCVWEWDNEDALLFSHLKLHSFHQNLDVFQRSLSSRSPESKSCFSRNMSVIWHLANRDMSLPSSKSCASFQTQEQLLFFSSLNQQFRGHCWEFILSHWRTTKPFGDKSKISGKSFCRKLVAVHNLACSGKKMDK